jgi:nicotinic acid phosphoribosyltransferase
METILNYFSPANKDVVTETGFRYLNTNPEYKHSETLSAPTEIELFEEFYKKNNQLRYCNGHYYEFADEQVKARYKEWLKSDDFQSKHFNLYYGNGIVD